MSKEKVLTGYPSIDKPWLNYYSEEVVNAVIPESSMYQFIWERNKDHTSDIILKYYGNSITFEKYFRCIKEAAKAFYAQGVRSGDVVTIMSMNSPETIYSIYALNYLGAIANIVYMTLSEKEILETINNTNSKLFLVLETVLERVKAVSDCIDIPVVILGISDSMPILLKSAYRLKNRTKNAAFLKWKTFIRSGIGVTLPSVCSEHSNPAVIVYTSGTTGDPKGVILSNDNLNSVVAQLLLSGKGYHRYERSLLLLPPFFGYGIAMIHLGISAGIVCTLCIDLSVESIVQAFNKTKPNRIAYGASVIEQILRRVDEDLSYLYDFTGGGSAVTEEKEEEMNRLLELHNCPAKYTSGYGMTELASVVCFQMNHLYRFHSSGIPLPKVNVRIIDPETGKEMKYNEIGEMCFSAPNVMLGYYKNEKATRETIEIDPDGIRWLHTGDLGRCTEDGFIYFEGKIKRIYTTQDENETLYKIFPQRIEELLEQQQSVKACAVVVMPDDKRIHIPIAFVVLNNDVVDKKRTMQELYDSVNEQLPKHMWAKTFLETDTIPMTDSGKVDYRALESKAKDRLI